MISWAAAADGAPGATDVNNCAALGFQMLVVLTALGFLTLVVRWATLGFQIPVFLAALGFPIFVVQCAALGLLILVVQTGMPYPFCSGW